MKHIYALSNKISHNMSIKTTNCNKEGHFPVVKRKSNRIKSEIYSSLSENGNNSIHSFSASRSKKPTKTIIKNKSNRCIQEKDEYIKTNNVSGNNNNVIKIQNNVVYNDNPSPEHKRIENNTVQSFQQLYGTNNINIMYCSCQDNNNIKIISNSPIKNKSFENKNNDNDHVNNSDLKYRAFSHTQKINVGDMPSQANSSFMENNHNYKQHPTNNNSSRDKEISQSNTNNEQVREIHTHKKNYQQYLNINNGTNLRHHHLSNIIKTSSNTNSFQFTAQTKPTNNTNVSKKKEIITETQLFKQQLNNNNTSNKHSLINNSNNNITNNKQKKQNKTNKLKKLIKITHKPNKNNFTSTIHSLDLIHDVTSKTEKNSNYNSTIILILSNWGNSSKVGISEIQLLGKNGKKIPIVDCDVFNGTKDEIGRIHNNKPNSLNDMYMWTSSFNSPISIQLFTIKHLCPGQSENLNDIEKLWIWNYNGKDTTKGVKDIEIYQKNELKWKGIIPKGPYPGQISKFEIMFRNTVYVSNCSSQDATPSSKEGGLCSSGRNLSPINVNNNNENNVHNNNTKLNSKGSGFTSVSKIHKNKNNISANNYTNISNNNNIHFFSNKKQPLIKAGLSSARNKNQNPIDTVNLFHSIHSHFTKSIFERQTIENFSDTGNMNAVCPVEYSKTVRHSLVKESDNILQTSINNNSVLEYISFTKMNIYFISNYGHPNYIGLTAMKLFDKNGKEIIITQNIKELGALPKDIYTELNIEHDQRRFENLFNNENDTIDENEMWVTVLNNNQCPYISALFTNEMDVSYIDIYNYNSPIQLDICTKEILFVFDEDVDNKSFKILLKKGLGGFDLSEINEPHAIYQRVFFTHNNIINNDMNIRLTGIYNSFTLPLMRGKIISHENNYNNNSYYDIITPILPCGFSFKFILISNWGNENIISISKVNFYDIHNQNIEKYTSMKIINSTFHNYENYNRKLSIKHTDKNKNVYYEPFYSFTTDDNCDVVNIVYFIFEKGVSVQYIKIVNPNKGMGVKKIQMLLDDNLIFEGELNKEGESYIVFNTKEGFTGKKEIKIDKVVNWNVKQEVNKYQKVVKNDGVVVLKICK